MGDSTLFGNMPEWTKLILSNYRVGNYHQFLLDGNIHDLDSFAGSQGVDYKARFRPVRGILIDALFDGLEESVMSIEVIFYYSKTSGLRVLTRDDRFYLSNSCSETVRSIDESILEVIDCQECAAPNRDGIMRTLLSLDKALKTQWNREPAEQGQEAEAFQVAVILDSAENIIPDMGGSSLASDALDRDYYELITSWGRDSIINGNGNLCVLMTENKLLLPSGIRSQSSGTYPVTVPIPGYELRKAYFRHQQETGEQDSPLHDFFREDISNVSLVAQGTKGFLLDDCKKVCTLSSSAADVRSFFWDPANQREAILEYIQEQKDDVISGASRGMLEIVNSTCGFDSIGGLDGAKDYFLKISEAIKSDDEKFRKIIPKGVLLTGPPGTGKSLLARALAEETKVNLVRMGNIRSMWVGESERNLSLVLNLLKAMAPTIVFIDEIDQALGARQTSSRDSGVSGRIFQQILEFMGDNANRGDVIWIAATNRADLMDDAMISRFDRIIPVLLPGSRQEWQSVMAGIVRQLDVGCDEALIDRFLANQDNRDTLSQHSGRSMETVLRLACQRALQQSGGAETSLSEEIVQHSFDTFKTNINTQMFELQTLLALASCNETTFISSPSQEYSYGFRGVDAMVEKALEKKSNTPLEERISELKAMLRYQV